MSQEWIKHTPPPPCASGEEKQTFMKRLSESGRVTPHWVYEPNTRHFTLMIDGEARFSAAFTAAVTPESAWQGIKHFMDQPFATAQTLQAFINLVKHVEDMDKYPMTIEGRSIWE